MAVLRPVAVMLASRVAISGALAAATLVRGDEFVTFLRMWDGTWYELIASDGYPDHVYGTDGAPVGLFAFFPLYPMLVHAVDAISPLGISASASVISLVAALGCAVLLWVHVRDWTDVRTADRAVALFAFFPGAFVLSVHYADGLMLCAALGCLVLLHRRRWVLAGVVAAICTATRPNGVVIVAVCAWAAFVAVRKDREWRSLAAPLLAPLGVALHFLYLWRHTGHAFSWYVAEREGWHDRFSVTAVVDRLQYLEDHQTSDKQGWLILAMLVFATMAFVLLVRSRPPGVVVVWTVGVLGAALCSTVLGLRPRFVMTAFPLFVPLAERLRDDLTFAGTLALFAGAQVTLAVVTALGVYLIP